jgi:hypothetical protein
VRVILVAGEFSKELTTAVLWLNENGLDLRCIRLQLYQKGGLLLADVEQIIPLKEAQEYVIQLRKERARRSKPRLGMRDADAGLEALQRVRGRMKFTTSCAQRSRIRPACPSAIPCSPSSRAWASFPPEVRWIRLPGLHPTTREIPSSTCCG